MSGGALSLSRVGGAAFHSSSTYVVLPYRATVKRASRNSPLKHVRAGALSLRPDELARSSSRISRRKVLLHGRPDVESEAARQGNRELIKICMRDGSVPAQQK